MTEGEGQFNKVAAESGDGETKKENGQLRESLLVGLNSKEAYLVSSRERRDLSMTIGKKRAARYWIERLRTELDILPPDIALIVKKGLSGLSGKEHSKLFNFISRRVEVLKFDVMKRQRMQVLRRELGRIDEGKHFYSEKEMAERKPVFLDEKENTLYVNEKDGRKNLGVGDILSDYEWGLRYRADDSIPSKTKRLVEKRIVANEARRDIERVFDEELQRCYGVSGVVSSGFVAENLEKVFLKPMYRNSVKGLLAEKMVREFLTRLSVNNAGLNFVVERSNAVEDAKLKYDFKMRRKQKLRGVAIEGDDLPREEYVKEKKKLGIQLTVAKTGLWTKQKQILWVKEKLSIPTRFVKRNVEDVVLVALDLRRLSEYFGRWLREGKSSGGPEQYFTAEEKKNILLAVGRNFLTSDEKELNKIAEKMAGT